MTQEEIKLKAISVESNGTINLGCMNGWDSEMKEIFDFVRQTSIAGSGDTRSLGRCYTEATFKTKIDDKIYTVCYSVDSGD